MVVLIKNAEVYEPRFLGKQDILILEFTRLLL